MWFKNIRLYRLHHKLVKSPEKLHEKLEDFSLTPCGKTEYYSYGWTSPLGEPHSMLVHALSGFSWITACKEMRILPPSVIRDELNARMLALEAKEQRSIGRREKLILRDDIIFDLLPKAFIKRQYTHAYIDYERNWIIIDAASPSQAEALLQLLRVSLGRLAVSLPETNASVSERMTQWVLDETCPGFAIEDHCEMGEAHLEQAGTIICRSVDLGEDDIRAHLQSGKIISKLALNWEDKISFVLDDSLTLKRIRALEVVTEQRDDIHAETREEQLDADFALMVLEFSACLQALFELLDELVPLKKSMSEDSDPKSQSLAHA